MGNIGIIMVLWEQIGRFWRLYHEVLYKLLVIESMGDTWDVRVILYGDRYIYIAESVPLREERTSGRSVFT